SAHRGAIASAPPVAFDFYLLSLTAEAAWCADGNEREPQCRAVDARLAAERPLVLHGLWPENTAPDTYPSFCAATALDLESGLRRELEYWMPGIASGLAEHEWRKHGSCTGLDDDRYFREALRLTQRVARAFQPALRRYAGGRVAAATLRAQLAKVDAELPESVYFVCKNLRTADPQLRGRPYLVELRVCVDNDGVGGAPQSLLQCASVARRDQGCGSEFWIK
ncbi:MAG: hypothetical protein RML32_00120, partial [Gammaproteobacteria bacterium]|nr:hypothetical protein [Gammaproteobacteria bacterium]